MKSLPGSDAVVREGLGGGFVRFRRDGAEGMILATSLLGAGAVGAIMPAPANGRLDADVGAWLRAWHIADRAKLRSVNQVHGATVVGPASSVPSHKSPDADGVWTDSRHEVLLIRSADCAVVWVVEPGAGLLAMLHAGWRGVAAGVVGAGVEALRKAGADTRRMLAAVGPHLRPCCFEVGPEVAKDFHEFQHAVLPPETLVAPRLRRDSVALDIAVPLRAALQNAGVPADAIAVSLACTRCRADIFHSYRRNGPGGPLMASIGKRM